MSFLCYEHLVFYFLLISNQLIQAQTLIDPNFDQALLPFGSQAVRGTFLGRCIDNDDGASFTVLNNCSFTVWAAAVPSGGQQLDSGEAWNLKLPLGAVGRVWGRTNCSFDSSGRGNCETGDCGGVLQCQSSGAPPNTLVNFALNQFNKQDFFSVSLVEGFNIPIQLRPTSNECNRSVRCAADITGQCPAELRAGGGCNNPCTVFRTNQYCCGNSSASCEPTTLSKFFKDRCPDAFSYPKDDATSRFTCLGRTNYDVVFCPS